MFFTPYGPWPPRYLMCEPSMMSYMLIRPFTWSLLLYLLLLRFTQQLSSLQVKSKLHEHIFTIPRKTITALSCVSHYVLSVVVELPSPDMLLPFQYKGPTQLPILIIFVDSKMTCLCSDDVYWLAMDLVEVQFHMKYFTITLSQDAYLHIHYHLTVQYTALSHNCWF